MPKARSPPRDEKGPKRPPNAWIIFRSDMNRLLRREDPKATQSALSKRISDLWATASPEVRTQYERRAEAAKIAHHEKYPDYKFAPRKKEDVAREREAKRLAKEEKARQRNAKSAQRNSLEVPPLPSLYPTNADYGPLGPSPPGSAAGSPQDFSSREPSPLLPTTYLPSSEQQQQQQQQQSAEVEVPLAGPSSWSLPSTEPDAQAASNDQWDVSAQFASLLQYNILQNAIDPLLWDTAGMDTILQPTGDPSIFTLNPFDDHFNGSQELSVSMGSLDGGLFNSSTTLWDVEQGNFDLAGNNFDYPIPGTSDFMSPAPGFETSDSQSASYDLNNSPEFDPYTNHSAEVPVSQVASSSTQSYDEAVTQHHHQQASTSSYVPPSGAAYASNRRVGGNWAQYGLPQDELSSHSYAVPPIAQ